ncbi:ectonucleoside triphosphate diphosphohydrolase 3 [Lepeophtheirus salmonis]|uniref:ectonucleoside triphosphate diphosphohydrolase 3 n=1 Tax=Lepeophtheirus salmonis TaxID=72036 RepID=UPI001AE2A9E3|nr:ectonucleoside triphosphate diphosphohydrolase 3-like [Lepeophtheirus salmonis]
MSEKQNLIKEPDYGTFEEHNEASMGIQALEAPRHPWTPSKTPPIAFVIVFLTLFFLALFTLYNEAVFAGRKTAIVIDAGSSHSHFTLFTWTDESDIKSIMHCTVQQGISTLDDYDVKNHLETCLLNISRARGLWPSSTRIFLGATAGMRHLSPATADSLMTAVRSSLQDSDFDFRDEGDAAILSGSKEGLYDWITINFLSGVNGENMGVMDMGGASCQLSYECTPNEGNCSSNTMDIYFYNKFRTIFTKSEPCYGINTAHKRYLVDLISKGFYKNKSFSKEIKDPCISYPTHFKKSYLEDNQCTRLMISDSSFDESYSKLSSDFTFSFIPANSTSECTTNSLFKDCIFDNCFSDYPERPYIIDEYIGEASLYWEFYKILGGKTSFSKLEEHIREQCQRQKESKNHPSDCFKINFIHKLLKDGYKFDQNDDLRFADEFRDISASWSLGFLLAKHEYFRSILNDNPA